MPSDLNRGHLNGDEWNETVEEADNVQETACDVLRNNNCRVIVLRIAFAFDVPVLEGPDDVGFICPSKLDFNLVSAVGVSILEEDIQAACLWLVAFFVFENEVAEAEYGWGFRNSVLDPPLIQNRVVL